VLLGGVEWIRAQARCTKSVEVFNDQGEAEQLNCFPRIAKFQIAQWSCMTLAALASAEGFFNRCLR